MHYRTFFPKVNLRCQTLHFVVNYDFKYVTITTYSIWFGELPTIQGEVLMYEMIHKVRFGNIGYGGKLRLYELPRWMQDVSIEQSESLGVGMSYLAEKRLAWLVASWQIDIERLPEYYETVSVATWPYSFRHSLGYRNYLITTEGGETLVRANAIWIHTDLSTMTPASVSDDEAAAYGADRGFEQRIQDMEYCPRKIKTDDCDMEIVGRQVIERHYADMHNHFNNAIYVDIASDFLPEDREVSRIRVEYRLQLKVGETLIVRRCLTEDKALIVFSSEDDYTHAVLEFTFK